jgi:hypothetical protein
MIGGDYVYQFENKAATFLSNRLNLPMKNRTKIFSLIKVEMILWIVALGYLLAINPYGQEHYSLCLFKNMGLSFCPGCGLGRSIAMIFHGDIVGSFQAHPLGIPGLALILMRIIKLMRNLIYNYNIRFGGCNG